MEIFGSVCVARVNGGWGRTYVASQLASSDWSVMICEYLVLIGIMKKQRTAPTTGTMTFARDMTVVASQHLGKT